MANVKISDLTASSGVSDTDLFEVEEATNASKKVTATQLATYMAAEIGGADPAAIHDNISGEIAALTEKVSPVSADLVIIEDSGDSNTKKKVQLGNLPGGGSGDMAAATYDPAGIEEQVVGLTATQTMTNKTLTAPAINSPAFGADSVDAITEIAASLKSGADGTLITGTAGTSGNLAQWNGDGDLVDAAGALGDYASLSDLASTGNGDGAALVGIEDSGGLITATTVEGALAENRAAIDALEAESHISNVVEDTTPQLGGDLDLNGNAIDFPTTANISDVLDEDDMASDSATALATQQSIKAYADAAGVQNRIINPQFAIGQRGANFAGSTLPANNDDQYIHDRWVLLSDGNDIVDVSKETTTVPAGAFSALKMDVETANKKFGIVQILEAADCSDIIGGKVSAAFKARAGGSNSTLDKLRAAVISWQGTADTVTSDVVSAWNAEGANPTLAANWTYESTPVDLDLTTSFQQFAMTAVDIDTASSKQVALFIWVDNTDATVGDLAYIGDCHLVEGSVLPAFKARKLSEEFTLCQRYLLQITFTSSGDRWLAGFIASISTETAKFGLGVAVPFRVTPTPSVNNVGTNNPTDGNLNTASIAIDWVSGNALTFSLVSAGNYTAIEACQIRATSSSNSYIRFDAEL